MSIAVPMLIIAVMVSFNALYVAAEFATVGSRRSRVQEDAEGGSASAGRLLEILNDPKRLDGYVAACQIGITLSSLVADPVDADVGEVVHRELPGQDHRAVLGVLHRADVAIRLVVDLPHELLDQVLHRHDPCAGAVLVDHHGQLGVGLLHLVQRIQHAGRLGEGADLRRHLADGA